MQGGARARGGGAGGAGVAADVVHDAGRGDQGDEPAGERAGERGEAAAGEHHGVHQGARRGGVLPPQEDPGYKQRELERQVEAAKRYAEEKVAGEVALKRGVSVAAAETMLLENGDRDDDIIF